MYILISSVVDVLIAFIGSEGFISSICIAPFVFMLLVSVVRLFRLVVGSL